MWTDDMIRVAVADRILPDGSGNMHYRDVERLLFRLRDEQAAQPGREG